MVDLSVRESGLWARERGDCVNTEYGGSSKKDLFVKFMPVLRKTQDYKTFSMIGIITKNNPAPKNMLFTVI